jgi:predicted membrane channel-forming protein YqfA (hemolysin III family)
MRKILKFIPLAFLIFASLWLRLVNLGYSDYVGDETKALYLPAPSQSLINYLFMQRKGPTQFLVTYLIKPFSDNYRDVLVTRLPFTLVGLVAIFFFYKLVDLNYGKKIALLASLLFTLNGIFIGLMRVVQYQPYVMLFSMLALYFFSLAQSREKWKFRGVYAGMLCWAAAMGTHYDGVFIAPFAFYLLYRWYQQNADMTVRARLKHLGVPVAVCAVLLAAFYVPLFFFASQDTYAYWMGRITVTPEIAHPSSSIFTFNVYNPLLTLYLYIPAGLLSLLKIKKIWPILAWFLFPWIVLEGIVRDPGTHIYTYIIPAILLVAFGLLAFEELLEKVLGGRLGQVVNLAFLGFVFLFMAGVDHLIYVDHSPEYPWEQRRVLFWVIGKPDPTYFLWEYGFPYNRHWREISDYVCSEQHIQCGDPYATDGYFSTNEDKVIAGYYMPMQFDIDQSGYYVQIIHPTNFKETVFKEKIRYWIKNYPPVKEYENDGRVVAQLYLMPAGTIDQIRGEGY